MIHAIVGRQLCPNPLSGARSILHCKTRLLLGGPRWYHDANTVSANTTHQMHVDLPQIVHYIRSTHGEPAETQVGQARHPSADHLTQNLVTCAVILHVDSLISALIVKETIPSHLVHG